MRESVNFDLAKFREASCDSKSAFCDKQHAVWHLLRLQKVSNTQLHVYPCVFGNHWHVGALTTVAKQRARMAERVVG